MCCSFAVADCLTLLGSCFWQKYVRPRKDILFVSFFVWGRGRKIHGDNDPCFLQQHCHTHVKAILLASTYIWHLAKIKHPFWLNNNCTLVVYSIICYAVFCLKDDLCWRHLNQNNCTGRIFNLIHSGNVQFPFLINRTFYDLEYNVLVPVNII